MSPFLTLQQVEQLANVPATAGSTNRYLRDICKGDVLNDGANGLWDATATGTRGDVIAFIKGQNLPQNYKAVDKWDDTNGVLTSIKSLDLLSDTYKDAPDKCLTLYRGYLNAEQDFAKIGNMTGNVKIDPKRITSSVMDIYVRPGTQGTTLYQATYQKLIDMGAERGITVRIFDFP